MTSTHFSFRKISHHGALLHASILFPRLNGSILSQTGCAKNTQNDNLFATPLKKVKLKIKIKQATDEFKNYQRFISN
jgi:hypothetical protein